MESDHDLISLFEHALFGNPVSTFSGSCYKLVGQDVVKRVTDNDLQVARLRRYSWARHGSALPSGQRKASPDKLLVHAKPAAPSS